MMKMTNNYATMKYVTKYMLLLKPDFFSINRSLLPKCEHMHPKPFAPICHFLHLGNHASKMEFHLLKIIR